MTKFCPCARALAPRLLGAMLLLLGASGGAKAAKLYDLADTLATNRILTKMAVVVQESGMITFLSSKGPFTFFVPTDAAFAKLPPETLDLLLQPQNKERLQDILLFHVVNGQKLLAKDLASLPTVLSCEGNALALKTTKLGTQYVMKAKIVHADIRCENGIIHEIDTVLMPPESALPPLAQPPSPTPTPDASTANNAAALTHAPDNTASDTNGAPAPLRALPVNPQETPSPTTAP